MWEPPRCPFPACSAILARSWPLQTSPSPAGLDALQYPGHASLQPGPHITAWPWVVCHWGLLLPGTKKTPACSVNSSSRLCFLLCLSSALLSWISSQKSPPASAEHSKKMDVVREEDSQAGGEQPGSRCPEGWDAAGLPSPGLGVPRNGPAESLHGVPSLCLSRNLALQPSQTTHFPFLLNL